jgi:hypothetical protein
VVYNLTRQRKDLLVDGPHFIIGLVTIFKQFHYSHFKKYILYLIHFIKVNLFASKDIHLQSRNLNAEAVISMTFLEELIKFEGSSRELVTQNLGSFVFDYHK